MIKMTTKRNPNPDTMAFLAHSGSSYPFRSCCIIHYTIALSHILTIHTNQSSDFTPSCCFLAFSIEQNTRQESRRLATGLTVIPQFNTIIAYCPLICPDLVKRLTHVLAMCISLPSCAYSENPSNESIDIDCLSAHICVDPS